MMVRLTGQTMSTPCPFGLQQLAVFMTQREPTLPQWKHASVSQDKLRSKKRNGAKVALTGSTRTIIFTVGLGLLLLRIKKINRILV